MQRHLSEDKEDKEVLPILRELSHTSDGDALTAGVFIVWDF
jgi:hypothetical protein